MLFTHFFVILTAVVISMKCMATCAPKQNPKKDLPESLYGSTNAKLLNDAISLN